MFPWVSHDGLPAYGSRQHPITFSPTPPSPSPPYDANAQVDGDVKVSIPNPNRRDRVKDMNFGPYNMLVDSDSDAKEPILSDDDDDDDDGKDPTPSLTLTSTPASVSTPSSIATSRHIGQATGFPITSSMSFRRPHTQTNYQPRETTFAPFVWDAPSHGNLTAPSAAIRRSTATAHTAAELDDMNLSPVADNRHTPNTASRNEFNLPVPVTTLRPGKAVKSNSRERIGHQPLMLRPTAGSSSTIRLRPTGLRPTARSAPLPSSTAPQLEPSLAAALAAALAATSAPPPSPPPVLQSRPTSRPVVEITSGKTWWVPGWCAGLDGTPMQISSEGGEDIWEEVKGKEGQAIKGERREKKAKGRKRRMESRGNAEM